MIRCLENVGDQRPDIFHPIALCHNYENSDWQCGKVLLEFEILISRQKHVGLRGRQRQ